MSLADAGQHIAQTTIPANRRRAPLTYHTAATPLLVIARIVWHDREEWWPARATGWDDQLVHVQWADSRGPCDEWIPAGDVRRVVVVPGEGPAEI